MSSASRTEIFEVGIAPFYEAIIHYEAYPEFADTVVKIQVLEQREDGARVQFFVNLIREFTYVLDLKHEPMRRVSWRLVCGDLFNKMDGSWDLKPLDDGRLEVTYSLDVEPKLFLPGFILNRLVSFNLPRVMANFHDRARRLEAQEQ